MSENKADDKDPNAGGVKDDAAAAAAADAGKKDALQFSVEQVTWINRHSDEMFGKGMKRVKDELEPKLTEAENQVKDLQAKIKELEGKIPTADAKDDKAKGGKKDEPSEDVKKLLATVDELRLNMDKLLGEKRQADEALTKERDANRKARIKDEFITAAASLNFFDANDVYKLLEPEIGFDDNHGVIVKNVQTGEPRMTVSGSSYRPLSLTEFLADFAQKKPQYVKAQTSDGGSGAGGSRKLSTDSKEPDFDKMTPQEALAFANKLQTIAR